MLKTSSQEPLNLQKASSHEPLAGMHWCLALIILGARKFKFVQMKCLYGHVWPCLRSVHF